MREREQDYDDDEDDERLARRRRRDYRRGLDKRDDLGEDPAMRLILPVGRSGWAIAAGYLGLFSLICFPAPLALLTGILAVVDIRKNPEKHGMGRAIFGIIMGALGSIVLALGLIGILVEELGRR